MDNHIADMTVEVTLEATRAKLSKSGGKAAPPLPSAAPKSKDALREEAMAIYRRLCVITQNFDTLDLALMETVLGFVTKYPGQAVATEKHFQMISAFYDRPTSSPPPAAKVYDFPARRSRATKPERQPASH